MRLDPYDIPGLRLLPAALRKAVVFTVLGAASCLLAAGAGEAWLRTSLRGDPADNDAPGEIVVTVVVDCPADPERFDTIRETARRLSHELVGRGIRVGIVALSGSAPEPHAPSANLLELDGVLDALIPVEGVPPDLGLAAAEAQLRNGDGSRAAVLFLGRPAGADALAAPLTELRNTDMALVVVDAGNTDPNTVAALTGVKGHAVSLPPGDIEGGLKNALAAIDIALADVTLRVTYAEKALTAAMWAGLVGIALATALMIAQNLYLKRPPSPLGLTVAVVGGWASGAAAGALGSLLHHEAETGRAYVEPLARLAPWVVFGLLAGCLVPLTVRNVRLWRGAVGGLAGGLAAGLLACLVPAFSHLGYGGTAAAAITGGAIGLTIALADLLYMRAWIDVTWAPGDVRRLHLGSRPVRVGSRARCDVIVPQIEPEFMRFQFRRGIATVADVVSRKPAPIGNGEQRQAGAVMLRVRLRGAAGAQPATASSTPLGYAAPIGVGRAQVRLQLDGGAIITAMEGMPLTRAMLGIRAGLAGRAMLAVVRNPRDASIVGLSNVGDIDWMMRKTTGETVPVSPGKTVRAEAGIQLNVAGVALRIL